MTVQISLTGDAESRLRERAAANGKGVAEYATQLVEQAVSKPTLEELLAPVRDDFEKTGMSPDEIEEFGHDLIDAVRRDRKAKAG